MSRVRNAGASLAFIALVVASPAIAQDNAPLLRALNAARSKGCAGRAGQSVGLRENTQLSAAAARIANGTSLSEALKASDYRSTRAVQIALRGYAGPTPIARGVAGSSCAALTSIDLLEVGLHQRGSQTWVVLAAPFTPPAAAQAAEVQARVLALVNEVRSRPRRCGAESFPAVPPLMLHATLSEVASLHAADMARHSYFSHTGRDGSTIDSRVTLSGYRWRAVGENIAAGQMQPEVAVQGWVNSPAHCANLMSPAFEDMGLAFVVNSKSKNGIYWVQVFGALR